MSLKVNSVVQDIKINIPNLMKIEKLLNDSSYSELIEISANFNTRLCVERKLRMPFLDPQTGVAQNHSNLFMKKKQRIPGLRDGQMYTYPSNRWRKSKRQYLNSSNSFPFNYRPFGRFRESEYEHHHHPPPEHYPIVPEEPVFRPNITSTHDESKDSHKEEIKAPAGWYFDEIDMHEMDPFEEQDSSDDEYLEPNSSRKKRRGRAPTGTPRGRISTQGPSIRDEPTPSRRGRGGGRGRGRKSQVNPPPMDQSSNSSDKFNEFSRSRRSVAPHVTTLHSTSQIHFEDGIPIPEHKIPTTERGKTNIEDEDRSLSSSSTATTSQSIPSTLPPKAPPILGKDGKPRAAPSPYCDFCLGDTNQNKKTLVAEELISCSDCGRSGHPTCLQFTDNMIISVRKYRWQCIECKCCSICGTSENDERLLFCDSCDAGFHMYCLSPPLENPPEGSWDCKLCIETFYKHK